MSDESLGVGLAHELEIMFRGFGATRENFWVPLSKNKELAQRVFYFVNARPVYSITVDYNRSLAEMIEAGNYDWFNDDINRENFPVSGESKHQVPVTLFHFDRYIKSDDAIAEMKKEGYRPAKIEELLALGSAQPDLQREFPIIALGSAWRNLDGPRDVPALWSNTGGRSLHLHWFEYEWARLARFLAVRI